MLATWNELADGSLLISSKSVPDQFCPPKKGFVRGTLKCSGFHIKPLPSSTAAGGERCELTLCAHADLGGSLPSSMINMLSSVAPFKQMSAISASILK